MGIATLFVLEWCPATSKYLTPYIDKNAHPIRIDNRVATDVTKNALDVLAMAKQGIKVIFPDSLKIYRDLEQQLLEQSPDARLASDLSSHPTRLRRR